MPSGACGAKSPGHSCTTASCVCCRPPGPRDVTPPLGTPHESGRRAEELAADFLRSQGFEILERNYRRRLGELDIIAERAGVLVIAEVRTRSSTAFGGAAPTSSDSYRPLDEIRGQAADCNSESAHESPAL